MTVKIIPVAGEILVNTTTTKNQQNATAAYLSDGRFVVAWMDSSASGGNFPSVLKAQLFDTSGAKSGGEFVINNDSGDHQHPSLTALSNGGFVAVWMGFNFGLQAYFQVFNSATAPVGTPTPLQDPLFALGSPSFPDVTALANGNFVVTWTDIDDHDGNGTGEEGIFEQTFSATGVAIDTAHIVNASTPGEQRLPSVAGLVSGGHVVVWQDNPTATTANSTAVDYDIKAKVLAADGTTAVSEFTVNSNVAGDQNSPEVAKLAGGGFVVIWTDKSGTGGDASGSSVKGQVYDAAGHAVGGEILINTSTAGDQFGARVAGLPSGGFVVAWSDSGPEFGGDTDGSIRAQPFNADGSKNGDETIVNSQATSGFDLVIDVRPDGSFAMAWGEPDGTGPNDVKARFFSAIPDDPAVAHDDAVATTESSVKTGSLFADNGFGADSDPDGPALSVASVNGVPASVGQQITLASGAKLTVNADGTYSYDPNGQYNALADASTGAVNTQATDSFTYALTNGNTATVTVTINGVASPGDFLRGDAGDNHITGVPGGNFFKLQQGGDDIAVGGAGVDAFYFGAALTAADQVDGAGGKDILVLQGDYSGGLLLGGGNLTNVETLTLLGHSDARFGGEGASPFVYDLTTVDGNVAAGATLTINASTLEAGENFTFDGHAETDGNFFIYGGKGDDHLIGGRGVDVFFFAEDGRFGTGDQVNGGAGSDILVLRGNYTIDMATTSITNVETVTLMSGSDARFVPTTSSFSYDIKTADDTVAAGTTMTFNGGGLRATETLHFDGALETNGNFRIFAGSADDVIHGGAGSDLLYGGLGADMLAGGAGNDTFRYQAAAESTAASQDQILDFASGDTIDLTRIDAVSGTPANEAFTFVGAFSGNHLGGELMASNGGSGNVWTVSGDVDGDGLADFQLVVTVADGHQIGANDFLL